MKNLYITILALFISFSSFAQVGAIQGNPVMCGALGAPGYTDLSDTTAGGTWISSNTAVGTVNTVTGIVTEIASGTTTISYTVGSTTVTLVVSAYAAPAAITGGAANICDATCTTFTDATGGGIWSCSNTILATVGSTTGMACALDAGAVIISYTMPGGCYATTALTVNPAPGPIWGTLSVCAGGTTSLSDIASGGTWSSANVIVGTVSSTGIATGISSGTATISYTIDTLGLACYSTAVLTVNATPSAIGGNLSLCAAGTSALTDATTGGFWTSSNTLIADFFGVDTSSGIVSGEYAGTATITYALGFGGCYATAVVTVNSMPSTMTITPNPLCVGGIAELSDAIGGGNWSSSDFTVASIGSGTGLLFGNSAGTSLITYMLPSGCFTMSVATVDAASSTIGGPNEVCPGMSITLTDGTTGGTWSSSNLSVASVTVSTGVVTGIAASGGTAIISYSLSSGCPATYPVTVNALPAPISGAENLCIGSYDTLTDLTPGVWSSGSGAITVGSSGIVYGVSAGTGIITYTATTGCSAVFALTVNALATITASATDNCGGIYNLTASGGATYSWAPSAGLSCTTCSSATSSVTATTTYTVTGTDASGCTNTDTVTINGNRISGFFTMTVTPTDTLKVWLIQFNSTDSSLTAEDSAYSCMDGGTPYYEFDNEPAGNYMVKAKLLSSVAGTSGYVPTYGLSTPYWDSASTVTHASATDTQHINMLYGTVPSGPGFIGGLISSGAGRNTSGLAPVVGMLVYLENAAGHILTYTYTNTTGNYAFSGLSYGTYIIYPVDYHYGTVPFTSITLSASADSFTNADFYQSTTHLTIVPTAPLVCCTLQFPTSIRVYPNPVANELNINWTNEQTGNATVSITNISGQIVYRSVLNMVQASGSDKVDLSNLADGIYLLNIKSASINYNSKIEVLK